MTVRSFVFRCAVFLTASATLTIALVFGGPVMSGAFFFAARAPRPSTPHPLSPDYRPVHQGHIDLSTGLYFREDEDLVLPGTPPFVLRRTYRTEDTQSRAFGVGASEPGEWYLYGDGDKFQWAELILEDGGRVHFDRISRGHGYATAVYQTWSASAQFYGARLGWAGLDWVLTLPDGSYGRFRGCGPAGTVCTITMWRDSDGHVTRFSRDAAGLLRRIDAGDQWIALDYDPDRRVSGARDGAGHTMAYSYDHRGRLRQAKASDGTTREYDYDDADRLTRIEDPDRIIENVYDEHGLCVRQRVTARGRRDDDPYLFEASYVTEADRIVRVDVRESGEPPVREQFTSRGSIASETYNPDTDSPTTVSYDYDPESHFLSSVTVTCKGRGRWKVSHSMAATAGEREDVKAQLLAEWCPPSGSE